MVLSAIFLRERITSIKIISLILTIIGVLLITGVFNTKNTVSVAAVAVGLLAGISYAAYSIINKNGIEKYNSLTLTFYSFLVASVVYVPFSGIFSNLNMLIDIKSIAFFVGLAAFLRFCRSCCIP